MLSIYDAANFQNADGHANLRSACKAICFTASLFVMFVAWLGELLHCVRFSFNLSVVALQLGLLINLTLITMTYMAIGMKRRLVGEAMDRLQATVERSMSHLFD